MVEINEVLYPAQYDSSQNFPPVVEVTEATGEDINRNRDAIIRIEHTLGLNPHIGRYTVNPLTATVGERLDIIENGIAEGRFAFRNLNVRDVLKVTTDTAGLSQIDIGSDPAGTRIAPVNIRGPVRVYNSGLSNNQFRSDVPLLVGSSTTPVQGSVFYGSSTENISILRITDTNANANFPERLALEIQGNVSITNGRLFAEFAVDHSQLLGIDTIPRVGVNALHVTRGDYHSHKRKRDPATGALLNEVDPNPTEDTAGLIDHMDLLSIFTKTGQTDFTPVDGVAYHVTGGDDHDHRDGRGAKIDHIHLRNIDPTISNHVTGGDNHAHSLSGDGAPINHNHLTNIGFLSHPDIDRILNIEFRNHVELIDPVDAVLLNETQADLAHHVPQGHVSDPSAHHARYTDSEALAASVLISPDTTVYEEGRNTTPLNHIQAIGSGTVSSKNPHGLSAADIGALEGFDAQGNLPDFTRQFLENAVEDIINDPAFDVLRGSEDELVTGQWTFQNVGGIIIKDGSGGSSTTLTYARASRFDDLIAHADNTGGSGAALPTSGQPPFHDALDIRFDPSGTTTPLVSTDVGTALAELDLNIVTGLAGKADNPVVTAQIDDLAVEEAKLGNSAVTNSKIANGAVSLAKLQNQYALAAYTFDVQGLTGTTTKRGLHLPSIVLGEIVNISVMWDQTSGSTTALTVDTRIGGSDFSSASNITGGAVDIVGFPQETPAELTIVGGPHVLDGTGGSGDQRIFCEVGEVGGGTVDVTVTVHVKYQHVA